MRRVVETELPVDLGRTLGMLRRGGAGDPCVRIGRDGVWRATRLPSGPATQHLRALGPRRVEVRAWGPGADEAVFRAPELIGAHDDDGGLAAWRDPVVRGLARRLSGLRLGRTGNVLEALVPTVLEQKVQGPSARASFRAMVRAAAEPAPRPGDGPPLLLPPSAAWLRAQPSWAWHRWGVERKRAGTIRAAAASCRALGALDHAGPIASLPGVGPWSVAEGGMVAFGDPDAVSVGDYWLKHHVTWTLAGEARGSDERMLELLAPYAGQRGRVCRLIMAAGPALPRFGPRLPLPSIAAL